MAKQRVQTQYAKNQVRLAPKASPVNTYVQPARNDQISKALDSVTGNVKEVQKVEKRRFDMLETGRKQAAQASFNVGYKALMQSETNQRLDGNAFMDTEDFKTLYDSTLNQVTDPVYKELLANQIFQTVNSTNTASSEQWLSTDLKNSGASFISASLQIKLDELSLDPVTASEPNTFEINEFIRDLEGIVKNNNGMSNSDIQAALMAEQERRGELFGDTHIGDYLIESGFGSPEFRNKIITLNARAKANAIDMGMSEATLVLGDLQRKASEGSFTQEDNAIAFKMFEEGTLTQSQFLSLGKSQQVSVTNQFNAASKSAAISRSVLALLSGEALVNQIEYFKQDGTLGTASPEDIKRAAVGHIDKLAKKRAADKGTDVLAEELNLYQRANLINPRWGIEATQTFKDLGAGNLEKAALGFDKLLKIAAVNPNMLTKYLTNARDLTAFKDFQVLNEVLNTPMDTLAAIAAHRELGIQPSSVELNAATDEVIKALDQWFDGAEDISPDDFKNQFRGSARNYVRMIAKYSQLEPENIAEYYAEEIKNDHALVNGFLVFTGNLSVDSQTFSEDATLYLSRITTALGAYEEGQISLRHTGRGNTFQHIDERGMPIHSGPLSREVHLDQINGIAATHNLQVAQAEAVRVQEIKANRKGARGAR